MPYTGDPYHQFKIGIMTSVDNVVKTHDFEGMLALISTGNYIKLVLDRWKIERRDKDESKS